MRCVHDQHVPLAILNDGVHTTDKVACTCYTAILRADKQFKEKIELEKIVINKNGLIEGHDFKKYDEALFEFMDILPQIRRNV